MIGIRSDARMSEASRREVRAGLEPCLARLWRYALVTSRARDAAEDLVQATCLRAIERAREIEANIFAAEVFRAIAQLPEAQREAALLVYCEGYSYAEAASALGIPIGT